MITPADNSTALSVDPNALNSLKSAAKQNSPEALKGAARQFEAMFLNMMMKSMRDATPQDGPMDNDQSRMFTTMLDQQISQNMAKKGMGLADMLVRQLSANGGTSTPSTSAASSGTTGTVGTAAAVSKKAQAPNVKSFQDRLIQHAEAAAQATGVPAKFMLGQAALESGWGKREIKSADGSPSHNLFGIKATAGWTGKVVQAATTEYVHGVPQTKMEKFRAYDSYADAFHDYANLLTKNPRYSAVLANSHDATSFAQGLQRAGYATDPHYAAKLSHIINKSLV